MLSMTLTVVIPIDLKMWLLENYITGDSPEYAGNKVQAIKKVREVMNCGLKEAKDFIDALEARVCRNFHSRLYTGNM